MKFYSKEKKILSKINIIYLDMLKKIFMEKIDYNLVNKIKNFI